MWWTNKKSTHWAVQLQLSSIIIKCLLIFWAKKRFMSELISSCSLEYHIGIYSWWNNPHMETAFWLSDWFIHTSDSITFITTTKVKISQPYAENRFFCWTIKIDFYLYDMNTFKPIKWHMLQDEVKWIKIGTAFIFTIQNMRVVQYIKY